jgi:hypothetical protein
MVRNGLLTVAAAALAACASQSPASRSDPGEGATKGEATAGAPATTSAAETIPVAARSESVSTESYSFDYAYPAAAGVIPGVKAVLDADLAKHRKQIAQSAAEGKRLAEKEDYPFNSYSFSKGWDVVTDLPAWLSLSAAIGGYEGGAHGYQGFDSLLWDKRAGKLRTPTELFQSERAFVDAVRTDFCSALDKERAERRENEKLDGFDECVDPTEAVVILGSSNGKAFDRIGFLIAPYLAGPYVEGDYEVTLPVTPALLAKVKPQYRSSFVAGK